VWVGITRYVKYLSAVWTNCFGLEQVNLSTAMPKPAQNSFTLPPRGHKVSFHRSKQLTNNLHEVRGLELMDLYLLRGVSTPEQLYVCCIREIRIRGRVVHVIIQCSRIGCWFWTYTFSYVCCTMKLGGKNELSLFFFRRLCGLSMFKTLFSVLNSHSHKQARKQRGTGTHEKQRDERAWLERNSNLLKNKY
jgi:hypothetical protein